MMKDPRGCARGGGSRSHLAFTILSISVIAMAMIGVFVLIDGDDSLGATVVASGNCGASGNNLTWEFYDDGRLLIKGTGQMANYDTYSTYPGWKSCSFTSVEIDDGVTSIGDYAFYECTNLISVSIPNTVTSIGSYAFNKCNMASIDLPDSVESIGNGAFANCTKLTSVTIPSGVTSINDSVFNYCTELKSITIPGSVTTIGQYAFDACTGLTSVTISSGVTTIRNSAFQNCRMTSISIPGSVTTIGQYAFNYCIKLATLTIGDSVTTIGKDAFLDCSDLKKIHFGQNVSDFDKAFPSHTFYDDANADTPLVKTNASDFKGKTFKAQILRV